MAETFITACANGWREVVATKLMIPGPVELDDEVLLALAKPLMGHRTPEFEEILEECWRLLRMVYRTRNEVALITGSGTAAMEAAVASVVEQGTRVLCIGGGKFGERLGEIAKCFGAEVSMLEVEWGGSFTPEEVDAALSESGAEVVTLTHNETSTGVLHNAEAVGRAARAHDAIFIADAITSVGGDVVETDGWGIDLCITGSQKCLAAPPGLGFVAVSERAWERMQECRGRRVFYLDLLRYRKALQKRTTPFTPSVTLIYGLHAALKRIERETLEARIRRHRALAEATRRAAEAMGLSLLPSREHASNTVTAIRIPEGLSDGDIRGRLKREYGVLVAGGQERLKGRIFRIGHMGEVSARELLSLLACIEQVLRCSGVEVKPGSGTDAAREVLEAELGEALRASGGG